MALWKPRKNRKIKGNRNTRLRFELLEDKRLLAIMWANEGTTGNDTDMFGATYTGNAVIAREIVNRAIDDWNAVILDQNFDNDGDPLTGDFQLNVVAGDLGDGSRGLTAPATLTNGIPSATMITLDDDGGGLGWYFDQTAFDDIEFTSIADTYQASFLDVTTNGQQQVNDFYRTITHEIGHALGIALRTNPIIGLNSGQAVPPTIQVGGTIIGPNPRYDILGLTSLNRYVTAANTLDVVLGQLVFVGTDQVEPLGFLEDVVLNGNPAEDIVYNNELWRYDFHDGSGRSVTFTESGGGHFYEGPVNANTPGATSHPNDLMNAGRTVPAGNDPAETTRQFISDLDVEFLADAYGYTVVLPSNLYSPDADPNGVGNAPDPPQVLPDNTYSFGTAHISLDIYTQTLLIQGLSQDPSNVALPVDDTITVTLDDMGTSSDPTDDQIQIDLSYTLNDGTTENLHRRVLASRVGQILIAGNGGTDTITVDTLLNSISQSIDYVVSSNEDALEDGNSAGGGLTNDGIIDLDLDVPGSQTTLRAAIVEANNSDSAIYVGRGNYNLTLTGSGGTTQGDLDITGDVTLIGAGAGATIIDAGGPTGINDRIFELIGSGQLNLSKVTLTGGNTTSGGGVILLNSGGVLSISDSALVENHANQNGSAVRNISGTVNILNSVFVDNTSNLNTGALASSGAGMALSIGNTIFAHNSYDPGTGSIDRDVLIGAGNNTNLGNNLLSSSTGAFGFFSTSGANPDYFGPVDYVVTSLVDSFDANRTTDLVELSLRETIDLANNHTNGANPDEIWMPAWNFVLTRDRATYGGGSLTDVDTAFGDLDISDSLKIRGISTGLPATSTQVAWKQGLAEIDKKFELLGDYDENGSTYEDVDGHDYLTWSRQYGQANGTGAGQSSADGNDDGIVNGDDLAIWQDYYGNTLQLFDVLLA